MAAGIHGGPGLETSPTLRTRPGPHLPHQHTGRWGFSTQVLREQ